MEGGPWLAGIFLSLLTLIHVVDTTGTTPNIQDIFIGRCHDFQQTLHPSLKMRQRGTEEFNTGSEESNTGREIFNSIVGLFHSKDCNKLWQLFSEAFIGKAPCEVRVEDYDGFANEADYVLPANKHMFWEGVYEFVHQLSYKGTRYTAASDILSGYLADLLVWCGNENGIDYDNCPEFGSCENEVQRSFWQSTSRVFASGARGEAFVMLNATTGHAHDSNSIFSQYELKYLESPRVTRLTAFLVSKLHSQVRETCDCSNCTIRQLEEDVKQQGLQFACEDNPLEVMYMLCVDSPNDPQCKEFVSSGNQMKQQILLIIFLISTIMVLWE